METSLHEKSDQDAALPNSTEQALPESTSSITDLRRSFMDPWKLASASALDRDAEEQSLSRRTSGSEPLNHDNERQGSVGMSPEPFPRFYEEPVSLDGTLQLGTSPPFEHRPQDRGAKENYYDSGERDRVIPKQVLCYLRMMFEGERLCKKMSFYLDWQSDDSYRKIKDAAKKCLDHSPQTIDKQVWRTDGVCKLFKMNQECSSRTLENEDENQDQWFEVLHLIIAQFVAIPGNEYTKFHLEITWAYAAVKDPVTEAKGAYSTRIANLIHDRMRTNWRNQKYIPQKDIHAIMSQTVIEHLIKKDKSLQDLEHSAHTDDQSFKKEQFIHDVAIKHKRLLALCVYEELDLICLWQMVYRNGMPAKLPLNNSDRPLGAEPRRFDSLLSKQWWFQPYQFPKPTDAKNHCTKLGDEVILPIEGCGERKPIGSGSSKDVYKVQVQSGHHQFTAVCSKLNKVAACTYADNSLTG